MEKSNLKKFAIESRNELVEKISNKIKTYFVDEEFDKEQRGDLFVLYNKNHTLNLTIDDYKKRELLKVSFLFM